MGSAKALRNLLSANYAPLAQPQAPPPLQMEAVGAAGSAGAKQAAATADLRPTAPSRGPVQRTKVSRAAWRRFWLTALTVVLLDQLSKWWVVRRLTDALAPQGEALGLWQQTLRFWRIAHPEPKHGLAVFVSWWHLRYVENPGAAWGFLSQSSWAWRTGFFLAVALLAMGFLLRYFRHTTDADRWLRFGLAIVFGGAVGNFIDRTRLGYVIDFVDWHLGSGWHWPTFNVADAAITCGVIMLLLDVSRPPASLPRAAE